jgi:hypothetical protein
VTTKIREFRVLPWPRLEPASKAMEPRVRDPRRERDDRPDRNDGLGPEFAPAFLTRDDD